MLNYARKGNHRCHVCFKNVDGKVQGRSKRAILCIRRPRESSRQGSAGRAVVLYEIITNNGKVCATCTDMYEESKTGVRCAIGTTEIFKVKVRLHQGLTDLWACFLFAVIMGMLTDEVWREPPWTMLFADNIVICEETRKEVERRLES